eukprot:Awhi_evm1s9780
MLCNPFSYFILFGAHSFVAYCLTKKAWCDPTTAHTTSLIDINHFKRALRSSNVNGAEFLEWNLNTNGRLQSIPEFESLRNKLPDLQEAKFCYSVATIRTNQHKCKNNSVNSCAQRSSINYNGHLNKDNDDNFKSTICLDGIFSSSLSSLLSYFMAENKIHIFHGIGDLASTTLGATRLANSLSTPYVYMGTSGWIAYSTKRLNYDGNGSINLDGNGSNI